MGSITRRTMLATTTAGALGVAGCGLMEGDGDSPAGELARGPANADAAARPVAPAVRPIGDGSTADTGPQPHQPKPERLAPGERPPQFVVFSWDGAGVAGVNLFERFRKVAKTHQAAMTFFLSGLYFLPRSQRKLYHPPGRSPGTSAIPFLSDEGVHETIRQVGLAWQEGHEIGTHFNGHFCGPGGVESWSQADWQREIDQAIRFVRTWRTNTGFTDLPALPFDYGKELIGGRTPCLEGRNNLLPVARRLGWKYDSSSPGGIQVWPRRRQGLWEYPLQSMPFADGREVLSMDYNILVNQSGRRLQGAPANHGAWRDQARDCFLDGFRRAYDGNRAPVFIGNHFEEWNGGIYMDAIEETIETIAAQPETRMVSFRQLVHWMEVQSPSVLAALRTLGVGEEPANGWESLSEA